MTTARKSNAQLGRSIRITPTRPVESLVDTFLPCMSTSKRVGGCDHSASGDMLSLPCWSSVPSRIQPELVRWTKGWNTGSTPRNAAGEARTMCKSGWKTFWSPPDCGSLSISQRCTCCAASHKLRSHSERDRGRRLHVHRLLLWCRCVVLTGR